MCEFPIKLKLAVSREFKVSIPSRIPVVKTLFGVLSLLILFHPPLLAQPEAKPKNVLVLATYNPTSPVAILWDRGIRSVLAGGTAQQIEIDVGYLELIRMRDDRYVQLLLDLYRHKYTKLKPDLIIPIYNGALEFVLKYGSELFPGIPVVFGGVERSFLGNRALGPNITGIFSVNSYRETLDLSFALRLRAGVLALAFGTILLIGYVSINRKHFSATATFSAHFEPPGYFDLIVQST